MPTDLEPPQTSQTDEMRQSSIVSEQLHRQARPVSKQLLPNPPGGRRTLRSAQPISRGPSPDLGWAPDPSEPSTDAIEGDDSEPEDGHSANSQLYEESIRRSLADREPTPEPTPGPRQGRPRPAAPTVAPSREQVAEWVRVPRDEQERLARRLLYVYFNGLVACPHHDLAREGEAPDKEERSYISLADMATLSLQEHSASGEVPTSLPPAYIPRPSRALVPLGIRYKHPTTLDEALSGPLAGYPNANAYVSPHADHLPYIGIGKPCFDIDSHITLFPELILLRSSVNYIGTPQPTRALRRSIHISLPLPGQSDVDRPVPLHHIPHAVFAEAGDDVVYLFLPRAYKEEGDRRPDTERHPRLLTADIHQYLFEEVVFKALQGLGDDFAQHIPKDYNDLKGRSMAHEPGNRGRDPSQGKPYPIPLNQDSLRAVWERLAPLATGRAAAIAEEQGKDLGQPASLFRGAFFVLDGKGLKLKYKDAHSPGQCIQQFADEHEKIVPLLAERPTEGSEIQQFLDLGAEYMPLVPVTNRNEYGATVLARRCCQGNSLRFLYGDTDRALTGQGGGRESESSGESDDEDQPGPRPRPRGRTSAHKTTYYPVFGLYDTTALTSEPDRNHAAFRLGLRYVNSYSPSKQIFDALGTYPFADPQFAYLATHKQDLEGICRAGNIRVDRERVANAFKRDCDRVQRSLAKACEASYGWRFEARVSTELARAVQRQEGEWYDMLAALRCQAYPHASDGPLDPLQAVPAAFFVVPSPSFAGFLFATLSKVLQAMLEIRAFHDAAERFPPRATSLFLVLAQYLWYLFGNMPWRKQRMLTAPTEAPAKETQHRGFGLRQTQRSHGFPFLPCLADWDKFQLTYWYSDTVHIPLPNIYRRQEAAAGQMNRSEQFQRLLDVGKRLAQNIAANQAHSAQQADPEPRDLFAEPPDPPLPLTLDSTVLELLVDALLCEFRQVALAKLNPNLTSQHKAQLAIQFDRSSDDPVPFTFKGLQAAAYKIKAHVRVLGSNRTATKTAQGLFDMIWATHRNTAGDAISKLSFHTLAKDARKDLASGKLGPLTVQDFDNILFYRFFQQHNAFPLPTPGGRLTQCNKPTKKEKEVAGPSREGAIRTLCLYQYNGVDNKVHPAALRNVFVESVEACKVEQMNDPLPRPSIILEYKQML